MVFRDAVRVDVPPEAVHLEVHPGALVTTMPVEVVTSMPAIEIPEHLVVFEPGAFQFQLDAPVQQDISLGKYSGVAMAVVGLLLLFVKPPQQWWKRGRNA